MKAAAATLAAALLLAAHGDARAQEQRARSSALVITVSRYADAKIPPLPGAARDQQSAVEIAAAMGIPRQRIRTLSDDKATGEGIRRALKRLDETTRPGDDVYVHFSGHGTRWYDAPSNGCMEALLAYDGGWPGTLTRAEVARLLAPIGAKAGRMFVLYDACHSGGVARTTAGLRAVSPLKPRFVETSNECAVVANVRRRQVQPGDESLPRARNAAYLSSSRANEVSLDDAEGGGLATQFVRACIVGAPGQALTIDQIRACAQGKIDARLRGDPVFRGQNLVLAGKRNFVPARW